MLLSELYIANGSEPWRVPDVASLPDLSVPFASKNGDYKVFARDAETLAREQAIPGHAGMEHRIGGLEKDESGAVSYDPDNHEEMTLLRAEKIARIARSIPPLKVNGERTGKVLVLGWGGSYGAITSAVNNLREEGYSVSSLHLRHLNPFPSDLKKILQGFDKILIPELNLGQLSKLIREKFLIETVSFNSVNGQPFKVGEMTTRILEFLK